MIKIVWIDILLSGDNALVIAMACHALPPRQRLWGMILGAAGAVALRIVLTGLATTMLEMPYLKIVGGIALLYVASKMLLSSEEETETATKSADRLLIAIRMVVVADIVMSIDNVIAVALAAQGNILLLAFALLLSIPIVVGGASVISTFLNRFPILVWFGGALLGWIAGDTMASDPVIRPYLSSPFDQSWFYASLGACFVVAAGTTKSLFKAQEWKNDELSK